MPSRVLVVEKIHDSLESISSSFSDDEGVPNEDEVNTSVALLPSISHPDLNHCPITNDMKKNATYDPDETTLGDDNSPDYDLEHVDATVLDLQGSPCHLAMNQTFQLTQSPHDQPQTDLYLSSPTQLLSTFPKMTLANPPSKIYHGLKEDTEQLYHQTYHSIVKEIFQENREVIMPQFSSSIDIDERISKLYEMIDTDGSIRRVLDDISHSKKINFLKFSWTGKSKSTSNLSCELKNDSEEKCVDDHIYRNFNRHESQQYSLNLSTANIQDQLDQGDMDDIPSIEVVRAEMENDFNRMHSFQSPIAINTERQGVKRLASASAKRGIDRKKGNLRNNPEAELIINDVYDDENSDPFYAYGRFSQHVNDLMKDNDVSVHSGIKDVRNDSTSFMGSALNSETSSHGGVSFGDIDNQNGVLSLSDDSFQSDVEGRSKIHSANVSDHSFQNDKNDETTFDSNVIPKFTLTPADSMIEDDDEEKNDRSTSLYKSTMLCYNPLDIYRVPKWAKSYNKRKNTGRIRSEVNKKSGRIFIPQQVPTLTWLQEPFKEFGSRESDKMEVVAEWLNARDDIDERDLPHRVIMLSLKLRQIISLTSHMLVQNGVHSICRSERHSSEHQPNENVRKAGTMIVARNKSDLEKWDIFLRERTSFTVLNHVELPSTERRRMALAVKASGYDIVLTTYDAIKSKEINLVINECGRAAAPIESDGGWIDSKTYGGDKFPQQCETLSQLHSLEWYRTIFIDSLGRQGYLTKPSTARSQASLRLNSERRTIFFERSDDEHQYFFEDKIKDSRRQLAPLAKLLDIPGNIAGSAIVGSIMLDYRDVREDLNGTSYNSISHSESSDDSSILTDI